ncbi:MAG: xanthine dehydrogenase family protein molybdopterin-binding subunit [Comamonadaceae bacterium]|nr:MAG: xanthine dehydrogenase family protein molybdopterin-binding subunit [Comamonadaceae bacterium]
MGSAHMPGLSRRALLGGGALLFTFSLLPAFAQEGDEGKGKPAKPVLPGSLDKQPLLDGWIRIGADGKVTVFTGKAELGQGIKTAVLQVAAEELVVSPARVTVVTADTALTADEGYTAGSHSMQDSATAVRHAAAQVRAILLGLAAQRLSADAAALTVKDGVVSGGGRSVTYGELVSQDLLHVPATASSALRDPATHTVIGQALPRLDIPAKVTGGAAYVQDLRLPGMVHGRVVRPPSPAATLASLDSSKAEKMPGVLKVVRDGNFVAVIASREFQAITAARALAAGAKWNERESLPAQASLYHSVRSAPSQDLVIGDGSGLPAAPGDRAISAGYVRPYTLHASIGPSCAVAQLKEGAYTVWTHSQGVFPLRKALAEMLGVKEEQLRCIHTEGSGCYGHNGADDVAADAALLARAMPGLPVRVQWMREDEHMWEPFSPPMVTGARATLDARGHISSWQYELWSNTHNSRPGKAGELLAARHLARPFPPSPPQPGKQPEGAGDRNAIPLYTVPNARIVHHFLPDMPLRVSALRGLGAYANVFSIESFMDELARAAGTDPVAFRLKHLDDLRARDVINLAAARFNWNGWKPRAGRGRGFAFARYKNLAGYLAMACEVEVDRTSGAVKLLRVVAAADSGEVVNPDGIRNQIEGGIVQSSSWTLAEEATFDRTRVTSRDWGGYPILRFPQVPQSIEVHIIPRPGQPFLGTGEVAQGPTPAMIANAIADATGARLRQLPFSRDRVRLALKA